MLFESVDVEGGVLRFRTADALRKFVSEDLFFDFGPGIDLSQVPQPILWTPGIYNTAAVFWLLGLTATVPFRSAPIEQGLDRIQARLKEIYPSVPWRGRVLFEGHEEPPSEHSLGAIALFSGGLDSVHTVYRHMDERPTLVRLISPFMDPSMRAAAFEHGTQFAARHALGFVTIVSNVNYFLKADRLFFPDLVRRRRPWWVGVQYGMGTASAAAPVAYLKGAARVYLASSVSEEHRPDDRQFASQPSIDDNVAWPGTQVIHDSFELSRQQKVQDLVRRCAEGMPKPALRVCNYPVEARINCGNCEKCLRTMAGLIVEGEAPADWGFSVDAGSAIARIRRAFEEGRWSILEDKVSYWGEIRREAQSATRCPPDFAQWLLSLNLEHHHRRSRRRLWLQTIARKYLPSTVKAAVRPILRVTTLRGRRRPVL